MTLMYASIPVYYKVVRLQIARINNMLSTARRISVIHSKDFTVVYPIDEWVTAPVGGLLVFQGLDRAEYFAHQLSDYEIWQCDTADPVRLPPYRCNTLEGLGIDWLNRYWERGGDKYSDITGEYWPYGTHAFHKIKLVKQVRSCGRAVEYHQS